MCDSCGGETGPGFELRPLLLERSSADDLEEAETQLHGIG